MNMGQAEEANKLLEHVVNVRRGTPEVYRNEILLLELEVACTIAKLGRRPQAIELLEHVISAWKASDNNAQGAQVLAQCVLTSLFVETGRVADAVKIAEHIYHLQERGQIEVLGSHFITGLVHSYIAHGLARAYLAAAQPVDVVLVLEHLLATDS